jgi:hypothetical protein
VNRVEAAFFSMVGHSASGDDRPYLRWHLLDHLPEQYQLPGILHGQRWAATEDCLAARGAASEPLDAVRHVVQYLIGDPVGQTIDDFYALGRRLAQVGRYPERLPSCLRGTFHVVERIASPRVLVSAEVVPWRPNRGIYLIVERTHNDDVTELADIDGVAGVWTFSRQRQGDGEQHITVCYLDGDPPAVAGEINALLRPERPLLAGPFESVNPWD